MLVTVTPVTAFAAESCGTNTNWEYKKDSHTIFISGTGSADAMMSNYESNKDAPWYNKNIFVKAPGDKVALTHKMHSIARKVSVNGTTSVGSYAFASLGEVTNAACSAAVKKIGHHAFANSKKLNSVDLPAVSIIRESAFEGCSNLKNVSLPSVERIDAKAFASSGLKSITLPESVKYIDSTAFSGCSGLTVTCVKGSYADTFCKTNNIAVNYSNGIALSTDFNMSTKNIELTVSLNNSKGFGSGKFEITYDSKKLTFAGSIASALKELDKDNIAVNSSAAGKLVISVMLTNDAGSDSFKLFTVPFKISSSIADNDSTDFKISCSDMRVSGTDRGYDGSNLINVSLHKYTQTVIKPTCKDKGYTKHVCDICGRTYTDNEVIDLNAHVFEVIDSAEPTCTENGFKKEKCSVCSEIRETVLDATGHSFVETVIAPTCTEKGYTLNKCSKCGYEEKKDYTDPRHDYVETVVAPTCTEKGYTLHKCSVCGDEYKDTYTDEIPHDYEKNSTPATCTVNGKDEYKCKVCGHTYTDEIKATGHKWDNGVIARPASKTRKGVMRYICNVCGDIRNEDIPMIGDNEPSTKPVTPVDPTDPVTPVEPTVKVEIKDGETGVAMNESAKYFKVIPTKVAGLTFAEFKAMFKTAPEIKSADTDNVKTSDSADVNGEAYMIILLGDIDGNGKINATDARLILRIAAKLDASTDTKLLAGDLNGDGKISASEARSALRFAARLENTLV